jgi:transcriptional regulator of acetoin/glycerol metabolism
MPVVLSAWNSFLKEDVLDGDVLSSVVASSWKRCKNAGVDPFDSNRFDIKGLELRQRLNESSCLVSIARPFMESLYSFVKGTGFQVILTDAFGFILHVIGDRDIVRKSREVQLCPGGNWQECTKGTNAIGTAIVEKKPVRINAWEHYCKPNHFLTCSAAPILDQDGQLIGVLDVSGDSALANPHTLGMVVASVAAIENRIRMEAAARRLLVTFSHSTAILDTMPDGIISASKEGVITQVNPSVSRLLGLQTENIIGKNISEVAKCFPLLTDILSEEAGEHNRDTMISRPGMLLSAKSRSLLDRSGNMIGTMVTLRDAQRTISKTRPDEIPQARYGLDDIIAGSAAMAKVKQSARMVARSLSTILITGETGTGKELLAHAIHLASLRGIGPFIAINCGALPDTLIESELFGYSDGAFTGSRKGGQVGKVALANGGTIFLDEIGDMPMSTQVKLLRVIQEKTIMRLGGGKETSVDVRIIASTNRDLGKEVAKGTFRQDLYYRLNVINIHMPALRERYSDIPLLINFFIEKFEYHLGKSGISAHDDFVTGALRYDWPGNVRELEHVVERAINLVSDGGLIGPEFLPGQQKDYRVPETSSAGNRSEPRLLREIEREAIIEALKQCQGNLSRTASNLGIGRSTLYRKLREYDIPAEL